MRAIARLGATVEEVLKENGALDLYASFFDDNVDVMDVQPPSMLPITMLSDPHEGYTARSALGIHFQVVCRAWHCAALQQQQRHPQNDRAQLSGWLCHMAHSAVLWVDPGRVVMGMGMLRQ